MRLWRIIAVATVAEGAVAAALASGAGLLGGAGGAGAGWFDLLNNLAPLWFGLGLVCAPAGALLMAPGRGRRGVIGLAMAAIAIGGAMVAPELASAVWPRGGGASSTRPLRIVSFNTWSDNTDPDAVAGRVRQADPDAAALIEMSWPVRRFGLRALAAAYPYRTPGHGGCPPDMVILSKRPMLAYGCQTTFAPSRPQILATIVWARTTAPDGRPFMLATTHYSWPFPHAGQDLQRPALARFVHDHADADTIVTGDFNLTPWTFALRQQDRALLPLTRRDHAIATWPAMIARVNRPAPFAFLPIDHLYAGRAWRTLGVARLPRAGSDHYGIAASFER